jgi:hypothetical protein
MATDHDGVFKVLTVLRLGFCHGEDPLGRAGKDLLVSG